MYPWESADTGEEVTPRWVVAPGGEVIEVLNGEMENHITADIAYAVWQYWQMTGDDDFLLAAGAEILLETARFWASRGTMEADGLYHIRHVIGPDEYHENVDDSAYTNLMAAWNMERGAELAQIIEQRWPQRWRELAASLQLPADEIASWTQKAGSMYTGFDARTKLFETFAGYFQKERNRSQAVRAAPHGHGRDPWPCPHPADECHQASRRGAGHVPVVGAFYRRGARGQLPLLRTAHRPWQLAVALLPTPCWPPAWATWRSRRGICGRRPKLT